MSGCAVKTEKLAFSMHDENMMMVTKMRMMMMIIMLMIVRMMHLPRTAVPAPCFEPLKPITTTFYIRLHRG